MAASTGTNLIAQATMLAMFAVLFTRLAQASACVLLVALTALSPFVPLTSQTNPSAAGRPTSPADQPARCRRAKDSSGVG